MDFVPFVCFMMYCVCVYVCALYQFARVFTLLFVCMRVFVCACMFGYMMCVLLLDRAWTLHLQRRHNEVKILLRQFSSKERRRFKRLQNARKVQSICLFLSVCLFHSPPCSLSLFLPLSLDRCSPPCSLSLSLPLSLDRCYIQLS